KGVLTQSATIPYVEGVVYELGGRLDVGVDGGGGTCANVTPVVELTIGAGVTIVGDSGDDYLLVNRCHRIEAAGTRDAPIVFTSRNDVAGTGDRESATGEWGGVVVLGNSVINRCDAPGARGGTIACENTVKGVTAPEAKYGGGYLGANSGTLEYVSVRHAGARLNAGLTLGGVGHGTTVEYVQVHNSSGDGVRVLGGSVNADHLVFTGNADEQLEMDEGSGSHIGYMVGVPRGGEGSDNGIEVRSVAPGVRPWTNAYVHHFTLLAPDNTRGSGIRVTAGAQPSFSKGIVVDGNVCLDYEESAGDGKPGYQSDYRYGSVNDPRFSKVLFDCGCGLVTTDTDNGDDPTEGRAAVNARGSNNAVASNTLDGFMPGSAERRVEVISSHHIGAFGPEETNTDNWAAGWTRDLLPEPCPAGTGDAGYDVDGERACSPRLP
ncbi:MAG: hypothetical protein GDA39_09120, partial [Hyphomonadaceae bacterium]|nr:hypothetical protein [Hyphomonadaceae bacterium]